LNKKDTEHLEFLLAISIKLFKKINVIMGSFITIEESFTINSKTEHIILGEVSGLDQSDNF